MKTREELEKTANQLLESWQLESSGMDPFRKHAVLLSKITEALARVQDEVRNSVLPTGEAFLRWLATNKTNPSYQEVYDWLCRNVNFDPAFILENAMDFYARLGSVGSHTSGHGMSSDHISFYDGLPKDLYPADVLDQYRKARRPNET